MPIRLLTEVKASGLIAVDKPPGLLVIPGRDESAGPALRQLLEAQLARPLWVVHRIDRDTSGVVIFALDAESHRDASMAFEHDQVRKEYLALVHGNVPTPLDIDVPLTPARKNRMRPVFPGEEGKAAKTRVSLLKAFEHMSWVRAEPETGRQHQIRVHLKSAGHPLVFDHQYGNKVTASDFTRVPGDSSVVLARTPLHAARVSIASLGFEATAPLPGDLLQCLQFLGYSHPTI